MQRSGSAAGLNVQSPLETAVLHYNLLAFNPQPRPPKALWYCRRRELVCASDVLLLAPTASVYLHKLMLADIDMPHLAHAPLYAISQALMPNTEASASSSSNSSSSSSTDILVRLQAQCRLRLIDRYGLHTDCDEQAAVLRCCTCVPADLERYMQRGHMQPLDALRCQWQQVPCRQLMLLLHAARNFFPDLCMRTAASWQMQLVESSYSSESSYMQLQMQSSRTSSSASGSKN
eukprot:5996-Heterococcus_DN1.PRE.1